MSGGPKRLEDFLRVDDPDDWELVIRGRQFGPARLLADALDMVELYLERQPGCRRLGLGRALRPDFRRQGPSGRHTVHLDVLGPAVAFAEALAAAGVSDLWRTQRRRMNTPNASGRLVVLSPAGHAPGRL